VLPLAPGLLPINYLTVQKFKGKEEQTVLKLANRYEEGVVVGNKEFDELCTAGLCKSLTESGYGSQKALADFVAGHLNI